MKDLIGLLLPYLVELTITLLGVIGSAMVLKLRKLLSTQVKADQLKIIDIITDQASAFVEREFKGEAGQVKLARALQMSRDVLEQRGILVSEEELRLAVENGVDKVRERRISEGLIDFMPQPLSHDFNPPHQ